MKPLFRGSVVLAASVAFSACGDPTDSFRGGVSVIDAQPGSMFVQTNTPKPILVQLLDEQGNPLDESFEWTQPTGVTVALDSSFLGTGREGEGPLTFQRRLLVTGTQLVSTSITLSAGGVTREIPVAVLPSAADMPPATVASTGPNATDPTVLTVPVPVLFAPGVTVTFGGVPAVVVDRSDDGRTLTVLPPPGTTTTGEISGLGLDYLPGAALSTSTDVALTISPTVPAQPGTDDPATAPEITIPGPGESGGFFDGAPLGAATCGGNSGAPCQLYKLTLPAETTFDVSLGWSNQSDLGIFFMTADGSADTDQGCDDHGNGAEAQPEACTITLPAGTYLAGVVSFAPFYDPPEPNPDWISLQISTH